jgi:nickel-type superoxide dismutase maturation protease
MLKLLKVSGESLTPEYQHGDFVLVSKIPFLFSTPASGDVVAFRQPGYGLLIKRIQAVNSDGGMVVIGRHPESVDSRVFGSVRRRDLLGKVILHISR